MDQHKQDKSLREITIRTEPVFSGNLITLQVEHVQLPNGKEATREVVKHPGAVAVLALYEGRMVVVEQYRKAMDRILVEIPAGKLDPGETPETAAMRELQEETGLVAKELQHITSFYTSPGFADEIIHLYAAVQLEPGEARLDEDEFLNSASLSLTEAKKYIASGRIRDAKTITAVYAWQLYELTGKFC